MKLVLRPRLNTCLAWGAFFLFLTSQAAPSHSEPTLPKASYVSPETVRTWLEEKKPVVFIDVRQPQEYESGHIEGAMNIPYEQVENRIGELDAEKTIVFYCIHSSWRAPYSANLLKDVGFQNVYILEGGIVAWKAGGQTIRSSQERQIPEIAPYPKDLKIALKHLEDRPYPKKIVLTPEELRQFDGQGGRPAYVAADGVIYDVTQSRLWREGTHDPSHGRATAGHDLTKLVKEESPHGVSELKKFPVVGYLRYPESDD